MNRPKTCTPKRPRSSAGKVPRSSKEAAINLVRLEFDVTRLSNGISQAEDRIRAYSSELDDKLQERQRLLDIMQR